MSTAWSRRAVGSTSTRTRLPPRRASLATHAVLYRFARAFCEGRRGVDKAPIKNPNLTSETYDIWNTRINKYVTERGGVIVGVHAGMVGRFNG